MTPLDLLYSWQSLFLAVVIATMTQSFKKLVEGLIERYSGGDGEAKRKASIANATLLPLFPLLLGGVIGRFLPIHPEYLVRYVNENHTSTAVYAMWGASIGQFSDYLYQRAKGLLPRTAPLKAAAPTPKPPGGKKKTQKKRAKPKVVPPSVGQPTVPELVPPPPAPFPP